MTNEERGERGRRILDTYNLTVGGSPNNDHDTTLVDIIVDVMHLTCGDVALDECLNLARVHYKAELEEERSELER